MMCSIVIHGNDVPLTNENPNVNFWEASIVMRSTDELYIVVITVFTPVMNGCKIIVDQDL